MIRTGDMVHFVYASNHYAAIVTHVFSEEFINLVYFASNTEFPINQQVCSLITSVKYDPSETPNDLTWHFIEP